MAAYMPANASVAAIIAATLVEVRLRVLIGFKPPIACVQLITAFR
jgi:hypothetical protein